MCKYSLAIGKRRPHKHSHGGKKTDLKPSLWNFAKKRGRSALAMSDLFCVRPNRSFKEPRHCIFNTHIIQSISFVNQFKITKPFALHKF